MIDRRDQGHYFWELRSCDYWTAFEKPKIVWQDISRTYCVAWDDRGAICDCTCFVLPEVSESLLAVLQSTLGRWWVHTDQGVPFGGFIRLKNQYMGNFPIPEMAPADRIALETLVSRILRAKKGTRAAEVAPLEREIDDRLYQLFRLTREEIKMVEESAK
jgi:adenine-specific DNA-methyltransferase